MLLQAVPKGTACSSWCYFSPCHPIADRTEVAGWLPNRLVWHILKRENERSIPYDRSDDWIQNRATAEALATVPESYLQMGVRYRRLKNDKLIAISKLFSVSVGWLLGMEPEKDELALEQKDTFTEEQLRLVERSVRRY